MKTKTTVINVLSHRLASALIVFSALLILIPWSAEASTITTIDVPGAALPPAGSMPGEISSALQRCDALA